MGVYIDNMKGCRLYSSLYICSGICGLYSVVALWPINISISINQQPPWQRDWWRWWWWWWWWWWYLLGIGQAGICTYTSLLSVLMSALEVFVGYCTSYLLSLLMSLLGVSVLNYASKFIWFYGFLISVSVCTFVIVMPLLEFMPLTWKCPLPTLLLGSVRGGGAVAWHVERPQPSQWPGVSLPAQTKLVEVNF